jgi:hypothetical protein
MWVWYVIKERDLFNIFCGRGFFEEKLAGRKLSEALGS